MISALIHDYKRELPRSPLGPEVGRATYPILVSDENMVFV
jgi:hypothetical protein